MVLLQDAVVEKAPLFCSQRLVLGFLAFLGNAFVYTVRVNLSVAILCMVKSVSPTANDTIFGNVTSQNLTSQHGDHCTGVELDTQNSPLDNTGEFTWDKGTRSTLLAMYFYGYIFTQIPGGWLASRFGGRRVWGLCMFVSAVCTLITPLAVRTHIYVAYALRFILGFAAGVTFPSVHAMLGRWVPPYERSIMGALTFAGPMVGNIFTFPISGLLCEYGFDNGWGSIFYISGMFNMIWLLLWVPLTADTPAKHKRIGHRERNYIETTIGESSKVKVAHVPWVKMFTSVPLWAVITSHFCNNWTNYTLITSLPTFMKESLKFDIKQNGVLSATPYLCQMTMGFIAGYVADTLRAKGIMSTKTVRKTFQVTSLWGAAVCIICAGMMTCEQRGWAVVFVCLCTTFLGLGRAGYSVNHLDLAPAHAGILYGISNTAATIPGMVAPLVAGALTPNNTPEEWRQVFYVCGAVAGVGGVLYLCMADGELQSWALPKDVHRDKLEKKAIKQETEDEMKTLQDE